MIKLVYCIRRSAGMSVEEFRSYWRDQHAPLVASFADALGARRYVQSHTRASVLNDALRQSRGAAESYDGITEVWWDSEDELADALRGQEAAEAGRALLEDERNFIDLQGSALFLTEEHEIF